MERFDHKERSDSVIVMDLKNHTNTSYPVSGESVYVSETLGNEEYNYLSQYFTVVYEDDKDAIDWPLTTTTSHHLEDVVKMQFQRELSDNNFTFSDLDISLNLPAIEIHENWMVTDEGDIDLDYVKYNGTIYTPKS